MQKSFSDEKQLKVSFHPEFLRETTAISDFWNPPKIVIGENATDKSNLLQQIYQSDKFDSVPMWIVENNVAETVKYYDNVFHAVKITFANEMAAFSFNHGVDSQQVTDIFLSDEKLNISRKYLRPGFSFGGSCLPKDLRAVLRACQIKGVPTKMD